MKYKFHSVCLSVCSCVHIRLYTSKFINTLILEDIDTWSLLADLIIILHSCYVSCYGSVVLILLGYKIYLLWNVQALIWSKMSTGLPIEISSSMKSQNYTSFCRLDIDIHRYGKAILQTSSRDVITLFLLFHKIMML